MGFFYLLEFQKASKGIVMKSKIYGLFFLILGALSLYSSVALLRDIFFLFFGLWSINKALRLLSGPSIYQHASRMFFDFKKTKF